MTSDNRKFNKWYLMNETTFDKMKSMEDAEKNFSVLDKLMKTILYNKKMNIHEKYIRYTQLFEKYLKLRKGTQVIPSKIIDSGESDGLLKNQTNIFESNRKKGHRKLSEIFSNRLQNKDSEADEENSTDSEIERNNDKTMDFSSLLLQDEDNELNKAPIIPNPPHEEYFESQDEPLNAGQFVRNPDISVNTTARELFRNNDPDVYMQPVQDMIVHHTWRGKKYSLKASLMKKFIEFTKKVEVAYPGVDEVDISDFSNYLVTKRVKIKNPKFNNRRKIASVSARKKSKVFSVLKTPKNQKDSLMDDYYRKEKRAQLTDKSRMQNNQSGSGVMRKIKWVSIK